MATVSSTGLSHRVNNIVRAFEIHGQLDKGHLTQALNKVVKLHPLLSARFLMKQSKLYAEINSQGKLVLLLFFFTLACFCCFDFSVLKL